MTVQPERGPRLAPLYAAGFVTAFGANGVAAVVGGQHAALGISLVWLGVFLALYDVAELVLKPLLGALADRIGPRPVIVGGLLVFAGASLIGVFSTTLVALSVARLLQGAGAAAFSPASSAAVARLTPSASRGRYFGRYGSWKGLGYAGGPVLGVLLVAWLGLPALFAVLAALGLVTAVAVRAMVAPIPPLRRARPTVLDLVRAATARDFVLPVLVLATGSAAVGALTGLLPALGRQLGLPLALPAVAVGVLAITSSIVQPAAGRLADGGRVATRWLLALGTGGVALGFAVVGIVPSVVTIFLGAAVAGAGVALLTPVGFAFLSRSTPEEHVGRTMGTAELGRETGDALGPLVVGAVGTAVSLPAGFVAFAVLAALAGAAATRLRAQGERRPGPVLRG